MKRAFTLIELLVVIAIIAILAAILFPVFARAKAAAKKTQAISNLKNQITGSLMYTTDYDDTFGLGVPLMPTAIGWAWDRFIPDKSLLKATTPPAVADAVLSHMGNAMQPYTKNINILTDPVGLPQNPFPASVFTAAGLVSTDILSTTPGFSYTYNGLLQAFIATQIDNAAATIVWWPGQGKRALQGAHYASPQLICTNPAFGCFYLRANAGCSALANGGYSFYTRSSSNKGWDLHNRTLVYAYADGHAGSRPNGVHQTGPRDPRTDPFALYNGEQVPLGTNPSRYWETNYCHPYLFRPDFDYQNWGTALQAP